MIALIAALQLEIQPLLRRLDGIEEARAEGFRVALGRYAGAQLLLCQSGPGRRAAEAARLVLERYHPTAVISIGVAGALSPELRAGDIVLCRRVCSAAGPNVDALSCDSSLLAAAQSAGEETGMRVRVGSALTLRQVAATPAAKAELAESTRLDIVEMEGHWVAQAARAADVPFLAVRAVLDEAADALPEIPGIVSGDGRTHRLRVLPYLVRRPLALSALIRLAAKERHAVQNLSRFMEAFIASLNGSLAGSPIALSAGGR